jgi:hypothetical protein
LLVATILSLVALTIMSIQEVIAAKCNSDDDRGGANNDNENNNNNDDDSKTCVNQQQHQSKDHDSSSAPNTKDSTPFRLPMPFP